MATVTPSALNALSIFLMVLIMSFLWRQAAARLSDSPWGQAMASVF